MTPWKTPDQRPESGHVFVRENNDGLDLCFTPPGAESAKRWAYIEDLITAADRAEQLQKAVDFAVDYLEQVATHAKSEEDNFAAQVIKRKIDEIKQLIKE